MELRQLRYFVTVVEEKTVTAAARKLNMTQPPLTTQLKLLEKELGCPLFAREGRRLTLTDAGRHFYQRACGILGMCESAAAQMRDFHQGVAGTLRIGVVSSVQEGVFTGWLSDFGALYPEIRYQVYSGNTYQLLEQVRTGQLDLAVVRTPFSAPDLEKITLRREPLMAVGRENFLERKPEGLPLEELAQRPLILYRRWEKILEEHFEARGLKPTVRCCNDTAQATLALAAAGMGVGILPASAADRKEDPSLVARPLKDAGLTSQIVLICPSRRLLSNTAQLFWNFMEEKKREKNHQGQSGSDFCCRNREISLY